MVWIIIISFLAGWAAARPLNTLIMWYTNGVLRIKILGKSAIRVHPSDYYGNLVCDHEARQANLKRAKWLVKMDKVDDWFDNYEAFLNR